MGGEGVSWREPGEGWLVFYIPGIPDSCGALPAFLVDGRDLLLSQQAGMGMEGEASGC